MSQRCAPPLHWRPEHRQCTTFSRGSGASEPTACTCTPIRVDASCTPTPTDVISSSAAERHCTIAPWHWPPWAGTVGFFASQIRAEPSHLAAIEVQPYAAGEMDFTLAAAIPRRRTDRRYYSAWPVSLGDISLMGARAARMGVFMRRFEPTPDFRAALAQAVRRHATDREYLDELTAWTGRYGSTAGVPAHNTPEFDPKSTVPGRIFAGTALAQPPGASATDDGGVLLALGTATDDDLARLRAGEATSVVLLTATALGLVSCPVTEPLEIPEARDAVRADAFGDDTFPQMLLRVGWAPVNADPLPPTPRRPLDDVVTRMDGLPLD